MTISKMKIIMMEKVTLVSFEECHSDVYVITTKEAEDGFYSMASA